jgi:hypothetical protein
MFLFIFFQLFHKHNAVVMLKKGKIGILFLDNKIQVS